MNALSWWFVDIGAAGILGYTLIAIVLELFFPDKKFFVRFKLKALFTLPLQQGQENNVPVLAHILKLPLFTIIVCFLIGLISYLGIDVLTDSLTLPPSDSITLDRVYDEHRDFVLHSKYPSPVISKHIESIKKNSNKDTVKNKHVHRFQRLSLQKANLYYNSGCASMRSLTRLSRELSVYLLLLSIALFVKILMILLRPRELLVNLLFFVNKSIFIKNPTNNTYKFTDLKQRIIGLGSFFGFLILTGFLLGLSFFLWGKFNEIYYREVIWTYHIANPSNVK